jgi:CoA:oxalate CoA-transferase
MCLIAIQGYQWKRFLEAMGKPEWMEDPRFRDRIMMALQYADEVDSLVEVWLLDHTKEEIFEMCRQGQITFAPIRDVAEVASGSHFRERGYFVEMDREYAGPLRYPGAPYKLSGTPWRQSRPAPLLGEHNEEVLCGQLGYPREDLVEMRRGGVI